MANNKTIAIEIGHWRGDDRDDFAGNRARRELVLNLEVGREINRQLKRHGYETLLNGSWGNFGENRPMIEFYNEKRGNTEPWDDGAKKALGGIPIFDYDEHANFNFIGKSDGVRGFYRKVREKTQSSQIVASVAVHFNAGGGTGFEVFTQTNAMKIESAKLSRAIIEEMGENGIGRELRAQRPQDVNDNVLNGTLGLKTSAGEDWEEIINGISLPMAYCEFGFFDSNDFEEFKTQQDQINFGRATAKGIIDYLEPTTGISWIDEGETTDPTDPDLCSECEKCIKSKCDCEFDKGDIDGNGDIDIQDVLELLRFLSGGDSKINHSGRALKASLIADIPGRTKPGIIDVLELLKYLAGIKNNAIGSRLPVYGGEGNKGGNDVPKIPTAPEGSIYQYRGENEIQIGEFVFDRYNFGTPIVMNDIMKYSDTFLANTPSNGSNPPANLNYIPFFIYKGDLYFETAGTSLLQIGFRTSPIFSNNNWSYTGRHLNSGFFYTNLVSITINQESNVTTSATLRIFTTNDIITTNHGNTNVDRRWLNASQYVRNAQLGSTNPSLNAFRTLEQITAGDSPEFINANLHNFLPGQEGTGVMIVPPTVFTQTGMNFWDYLRTLEV
jgi:N-acetylmuramoyl-L-alanine amidase